MVKELNEKDFKQEVLDSKEKEIMSIWKERKGTNNRWILKKN